MNRRGFLRWTAAGAGALWLPKASKRVLVFDMGRPRPLPVIRDGPWLEGLSDLERLVREDLASLFLAAEKRWFAAYGLHGTGFHDESAATETYRRRCLSDGSLTPDEYRSLGRGLGCIP